MDVLMPQLGETVAEGTVANWHKKVGDTVAVDEILFDVETDKVSMEVPSLAAGVITKILVPAGTTVEVGTVLAVIESGAEASAQPPAASPRAPAPRRPPPRVRPRAADAAAATAEAPPPGWYAAMPPSMSGAAEQYTPRTSANGSSARPAATSHAAPRGEMRLSPAVRRLAAEYRVDLAAVSGSGRNGRITRRNVVDFIEAMKSRPAPAAAAAPAQPRTGAAARRRAGRARAVGRCGARARGSGRRSAAVHAHPQAHGRAHGSLEGDEPARAASRRGRLLPRRSSPQDRARRVQGEARPLAHVPAVHRARGVRSAARLPELELERARRRPRAARARESRASRSTSAPKASSRP